METTTLFSSFSLPSAYELLTVLQDEAVELISLVWAEAVMFAIAGLAYVMFCGGMFQTQVAKKGRKVTSDKTEDSPRQVQAGLAQKSVQRPQESKVGCLAAKGDSKKIPVVGESAARKEFEVSSPEVTRSAKVISSMGKAGRLWEAVDIFDKLKRNAERGQAGLSTLVYNCLLDACIECDNMDLALKYFEEVKNVGLADVVSYNTLMKGHFAMGNLKAAEDLSSEMTKNDVAPNRITYHGLMNSRVQRGDRDGAWALVDDMRNGGRANAPNEVTCSILLKTLGPVSCKRDFARIMELADTIENPMDEVLFANTVEACIRIGRLDLLSERAKKYGQNGGLLKLTAPTYGSMIKAYGQAHDLERVWKLWEQMSSREVKPTAITLGCMVDALVMNHCVNDAWELVQKIQRKEGYKDLVNAVIYSTILKGFSICNQPDKVVELYDEMQENNIETNTITYNTILNAYARCSAMHRVPQLLEDMKKTNPPVEPDIVTFSTIVKGYCMSGDVDKGFEILQEMKKDGKFVPDEVLFNSLLDGCARQHRLEDALSLLDEMRKADIMPSNYTLSILVKLLSRARRLGQAFSMVDYVSKENGFQPNVQVWTCLIQACFHNRQVGKALAVYDDVMLNQRCLPDEKLYSALVKGCLHAGNIDKAVEFVRCAHHLPGHSLPQHASVAPGVEPRCVDEVVARLGGASTSTAKELLEALLTRRKSTSSCKTYRN